jgi:hypothetical protein
MARAEEGLPDGVGSAVQDGCDTLREQAVELAVEDADSPLYGADAPHDSVAVFIRSIGPCATALTMHHSAIGSPTVPIST